ncbi:MAG: heparin lyase I family protein, partial [Cyanophyceae cyanobacterium]
MKYLSSLIPFFSRTNLRQQPLLITEGQHKHVSKKRKFALALSAGISAFALPFVFHSVQAKVYTRYDFEGGIKGLKLQTHNKRCSSTDKMFQTIANPVHSGRKSLQVHLANCDERAEVVLPRLQEGKEVWIGWNVMVPNDKRHFNGRTPKTNWTLTQQFEAAGIWQKKYRVSAECGFPYKSNLQIFPRSNRYNYKVVYSKGRNGNNIRLGCKSVNIPLQKGKWEQFVMQVKPTEGGNGYLRIWKDGKQYLNFQGALLPPGFAPGPFKLGAYVGDPGRGERVLFFDEIRIGDSAQEVIAQGSGGSLNLNDSSPNSNSTPNTENLAIRKPVKVTSQPRSDYLGRFAVDGKTDTRWAAQNYPQEITITLADRPVPI